MEIAEQPRVISQPKPATNRANILIAFALRLALWLFGSVLAIVLLEHNALLGLAFALVAGLVFGASLFWQRGSQ